VTNKLVYVVLNLRHKPCKRCTNVHKYISRPSDHARCGTPVGMSEEIALDIAKAEGISPEEAVIVAPDDTIVVLDSSARKLKQQNNKHVQLDQVFIGMRNA
jgi:hypothetical protein